MEEEVEVLGAFAEDEGDEGGRGKLQGVDEEDEADEGEQEEGWKEGATMGADASNTPNAPVPIHKDSDDDEADENPAPLENSPYLPIPRIPNPGSFEYTTSRSSQH
ncbi:hypothetical protein VKT23_013952 [Stygiomarasmius scandens]|uniref:Uncharacterized protein n=1 Tax=Marasmiellus scandens TaxID=2682957 RepID=A0ABR1J6K4_9AGAR